MLLFIPICLVKPSFLTSNNDHRNQAYIDLNKLPENAEKPSRRQKPR
ncbi:hypothetical protein ACLB1T_02045 [Escherichia coli]